VRINSHIDPVHGRVVVDPFAPVEEPQRYDPLPPKPQSSWLAAHQWQIVALLLWLILPIGTLAGLMAFGFWLLRHVTIH